MSTVEGKTIIVTGAANGIGRGEAECLVASGAQVVFTDVDEANGEATVKPLGDRALFLRHDVSSAAEWQKVIAATKQRFGKIDGLVNNAGIYRPGTLATTTDEIFDSQIAINQKGTFLGMKYVSEELKATGGGAIVNTSSLCGIRGIQGCIAYNSM